MLENEFDEIITEPLFTEDKISYVTLSNCIGNFILSDNMVSMQVRTDINERLEKIEKQIKQLEKIT